MNIQDFPIWQPCQKLSIEIYSHLLSSGDGLISNQLSELGLRVCQQIAIACEQHSPEGLEAARANLLELSEQLKIGQNIALLPATQTHQWLKHCKNICQQLDQQSRAMRQHG